MATALSGVSGEYFVCAELSRRGYVASLTLRNTRGIDILAANSDATESVGIQVKTTQGNKPIWMLGKDAENADQAKNLVFVFVRLNGLAQPAYYVVPRRSVANYVRKNHERWLSSPKRDGSPRKDTRMRIFKDLEEVYKDRWELLGLD